MHYLYDENGMPMAIRFRTSEYVVGEFDTYQQGDNTYCTLRNAKRV